MDDGYLKVGDVILIDSRDDNSITEVKITDLSPSGEYMEVTPDSRKLIWLHTNRHLETLQVAEGTIDDFEDVSETAEEILETIRNRNKTKEVFDSEVIELDKFAELDSRNSKT